MNRVLTSSKVLDGIEADLQKLLMPITWSAAWSALSPSNRKRIALHCRSVQSPFWCQHWRCGREVVSRVFTMQNLYRRVYVAARRNEAGQVVSSLAFDIVSLLGERGFTVIQA